MPTADAAGVSDFSQFWSIYPRKVGKAETLRKWKRLSSADRSAAIVAAGHHAEYVKLSGTELRYVPYPSTFIGPKRTWEDWTDGPPPGHGGNGDGPAPVKDPLCPDCNIYLTVDEIGEHCSGCGLRPS